MTFDEWWKQQGSPETRQGFEIVARSAWDAAAESERRKGYGPGFTAIAHAAEPVAEFLVSFVRDHTPDMTGRGVVAMVADNIAIFGAHCRLEPK